MAILPQVRAGNRPVAARGTRLAAGLLLAALAEGEEEVEDEAMPWEADGPRWHTVERVSHGG